MRRVVPGLVLLVAGAALAAAPPAPAGRVLVIPIDGEIDLGLAPFVSRVLGKATPADTVILQVNTFGGRIDAAVQIRDALLAAHARTVAFVDRRAISAGALISLACDSIVMTRGATLGAATPVQISGGEMKPVEAKVVSYMRKEMKATAEAKHRPGDVAEAMVDTDVVVPGLNAKGQLVTLTTEEALRFKIADAVADDEPALLRWLGRPDAQVERASASWAERLARFLSNSAVSGILMTLGLLGILIELWSPGHMLAAGVGVLLLALFFFGHLVVKLTGLESVLLFVVGVGLVLVEVFAMPGHILPGIVGALCILGSLVLALVDIRHVPLDVQWHLGSLRHALATVASSLVATAVVAAVAFRLLPETRFGRRLVLSEAVGGAPEASRGRALLGSRGPALTPLRPAGKAEVGGSRLDVVTDGDFIAAGETVEVVRVEGMKIVVRRASA
jgi:membrane-bound serine protease (ClpP class)